MADYDQNDLELCKDVLKTKDGIERLALYHKSVGRLDFIAFLFSFFFFFFQYVYT